MATVKRKPSKETTETIFNNTPSRKVVDEEINPYQLELLGEIKGDTVYIHNLSGSNFHIEPSSNKPNEHEDTAVKFNVNEVKVFSKNEVDNRRFKKALMSGQLRIVTEEQANKVALDAKKEISRSGKKHQGGLAASGLPNSTKAALNYIFECEDIDELESFAELDEREAVQAAIEERVEELEEGEYKN